MDNLRTDFSELLGIRYPIVQAPIGSATTPELAAAVSNAGGLGSLSVTWRDLADVAIVISQTTRLTAKPFAVNVVLEWPQEERIRVALDAGAPIVWTFWGDPTAHVSGVHAAGAVIFHSVGSSREAVAAAAAGVDVVVAQGVEAGGHVWGTTPWRELLADVLRLRIDRPVLVAGGMADGRDVASALKAGADGACMGTRFLCSHEANVEPSYQQAILDAAEGGTTLTNIFDKGWPDAPHRVLRNSTVRVCEASGRSMPGERPGEHDVIATLPSGRPVERYSDTIPVRGTRGELEAMALYAGESSARIHDVQPAADLVRRVVSEMGSE